MDRPLDITTQPKTAPSPRLRDILGFGSVFGKPRPRQEASQLTLGGAPSPLISWRGCTSGHKEEPALLSVWCPKLYSWPNVATRGSSRERCRQLRESRRGRKYELFWNVAGGGTVRLAQQRRRRRARPTTAPCLPRREIPVLSWKRTRCLSPPFTVCHLRVHL